MVIGDRRPWADMRQPWIKRQLQKLGSRFVSYLAGREIPDAVSGFRAMTREAALQTHIVTGFSYTIESVLQACSRGLAIEFVPITTSHHRERPSVVPQYSCALLDPHDDAVIFFYCSWATPSSGVAYWKL
ncbi:MAG: hypothetical protein R3C49_07420 [Planctomycetaceae bacterium]